MFGLSAAELRLLRRLKTPRNVQDYLDTLAQNHEPEGDTCLSPRRVMREKRAHCIEGAMLAALAFRLHGQKPLILDLESAVHDFDHVVALFKQHGCWGAVSKTNHAVLRYREPVYRTIRELVLSYFHEYFDQNGFKTLRRYSHPVDLSRFDKQDWMTSERDVWPVAQHLVDVAHESLLTRAQIATLRRADAIEIKIGEIVEWKRVSGFYDRMMAMSENPFLRINQDRERMLQSIEYLRGKSKILFLTTSNRWLGEKNDLPKSTLLANRMAELVGERVTIIDVTTLKIYPCEGNVSTGRGNTCGEKAALLDDQEKNPSGCHRCYASMNNPDDQLWEISKPLLEADAVVFFGSVRWGQMNAFYQKLIERLTWLENRHSTLGESNVLAHIDAGLIATGHNWRGKEIVEMQKQVHGFFGFKTPDELYWNWSYTTPEDESNVSYQRAGEVFKSAFLC